MRSQGADTIDFELVPGKKKGHMSQEDIPCQTVTEGSTLLKWARNPIQPGKWPQKRDKHKPQSLFVPGSVSSVGLRQKEREGWRVFMASVYATPGLRLDGRLQTPGLSIHHFLMASDLLLKIHVVGFEEIIVAPEVC